MSDRPRWLVLISAACLLLVVSNAVGAVRLWRVMHEHGYAIVYGICAVLLCGVAGFLLAETRKR